MALTKTAATKRWQVVSKNGTLRSSKDSRDAARASKRASDKIWDSWNERFVR